MDWLVLEWNVRGLNDKDKRLADYNKIDESNCAIVCLQETKCESFEHSFIRSFAQSVLIDLFSPSAGASGGIIVLWNINIFEGNLIEIQRPAIKIFFTSRHINCSWTLVIFYGPCRGIERDNFVQWLHDLVIPFHENWLLVGDFNFMRSIDIGINMEQI
jgi:hypothetical protein